jgi:hypothetical protein
MRRHDSERHRGHGCPPVVWASLSDQGRLGCFLACWPSSLKRIVRGLLPFESYYDNLSSLFPGMPGSFPPASSADVLGFENTVLGVVAAIWQPGSGGSRTALLALARFRLCRNDMHVSRHCARVVHPFLVRSPALRSGFECL